MLKNKTKIVAIILAIILLFTFSVSVLAENEAKNDDTMLISTNDDPQQSTINSDTNNVNNPILDENSYKKSDVYLMGNDIVIDYIVDGNLFVMANTVTINSQIGGDAFIFAKNLVINNDAYIFSNLFTTSQSVEVKGVVYDIYAMSEHLTISGGYVYRDIKSICNNLTINGTIGRNVFVECNSINFNTDESNNGSIFGDLNYTAKSEFSIPEGVVSGTTNFSKDMINSDKTAFQTISDYILDLGTFISFVLIIWLICLFLAPKFLYNTNNYVGKKTLSILGIGLLTLIAIPIVCIILLLLQITSTFSLFLLALYIMALVVSKSLFTITANNYICTKFKINKKLGIFGMLIISSLIVWALSIIPKVGWIFSFAILLLGLGILISSILPKKLLKSNEEEKHL